METNNIRAAIQIEDFDECQEAWKESDFFDGSIDFYTFITTPTPEREAFIKSRNHTYDFMGAVVISKIQVNGIES